MIDTPFAAPPAWQIDPTRVQRIAVLCGPALVLLEHAHAEAPDREVRAVAGLSLESIIEEAVAAHCGALWLLPASGTMPCDALDARWLVEFEAAARACLALPQVMPDYPLRVHELSQKNRLAGLVVQRRGGGLPMGVYAAWLDVWNVVGVLGELPEDPLARARTFAQGVRLAAFALDAQLRFSPSYTGLQVLRQTLARKPYAIPPLSGWARDLVLAHRPTYVQWCRPITAREQTLWQHEQPRRGLVLHKYDRNSSFTAAAGEVPVGDPQRTREYVPGSPGLYRLRVVSAPYAVPTQLPGPFHVGEGAGEYPIDPAALEDVWAWEPQIRHAARLGWYVEVLDGWYWPKGKQGGQVHDLFRVWRERLWLARTQAEAVEGPVGRVAKAIIKRVGVATIGRLLQQQGRAVMQQSEAQARELAILSHEVDDWGELTGVVEVDAPLGRVDLQQPHWWSTIIANANERLMQAITAHVAAAPVAAYVDAVYCLGTWPPEDVEPRRLGKWKVERETFVDDLQVDQLNALAGDPTRDGAYTWVAQVARYAGVRDDEP